jgi:hypothetical protein
LFLVDSTCTCSYVREHLANDANDSDAIHRIGALLTASLWLTDETVDVFNSDNKNDVGQSTPLTKLLQRFDGAWRRIARRVASAFARSIGQVSWRIFLVDFGAEIILLLVCAFNATINCIDRMCTACCSKTTQIGKIETSR